LVEQGQQQLLEGLLKWFTIVGEVAVEEEGGHQEVGLLDETLLLLLEEIGVRLGKLAVEIEGPDRMKENPMGRGGVVLMVRCFPRSQAWRLDSVSSRPLQPPIWALV
jgi:hypothetical protein